MKKNTTTQLCPFSHTSSIVSTMKNISAEQFSQDPDLINCLINRKIKQLVILSERMRVEPSSPAMTRVKRLEYHRTVYQTLITNNLQLHGTSLNSLIKKIKRKA